MSLLEEKLTCREPLPNGRLLHQIPSRFASNFFCRRQKSKGLRALPWSRGSPSRMFPGERKGFKVQRSVVDEVGNGPSRQGREEAQHENRGMETVVELGRLAIPFPQVQMAPTGRGGTPPGEPIPLSPARGVLPCRALVRPSVGRPQPGPFSNGDRHGGQGGGGAGNAARGPDAKGPGDSDPAAAGGPSTRRTQGAMVRGRGFLS